MLKLRLCLAGMSLLLSALAAGQESHPYNGEWTIRLDTAQVAGMDGRLVIDGGGGTWDVRYMSNRNPCVGKEAPVVVRKATADELAFDVDFSKVLAGCNVVSYTVRPTGDGTLQGQSADGSRKLVLKRE